jgi:hypothetical protein
VALLSLFFAVSMFIGTAWATHLPQLLQSVGATLAVAIGVGALVGPAQVAGRVLEFGFLRRVHPLLSARLSSLAHPLGIAVLLLAGAAGGGAVRGAARRGQRHPHHRQGHAAAGAVRRRRATARARAG